MADPAPDPFDDAIARNRFIMINLARVGGVALTVFSMLILGGAIGAPYAVGYVLLGLGLVGIYAVPQMLVRRWRTPSDSDSRPDSGPE